MSESVRFFEIDGKQAAALAVLLAGGDFAAAALAADVSERTLRRWRDDPEFSEALRAGKRAALERVSLQAYALAREALEALRGVMGDKGAGAGARVRAASAVLNATLTLHEAARLQDRVQVIEARLEGR